MITVALLVFLLLMLLGVPVAFAIGAAGLAGLAWSGEFPMIIVMQQIHQSVDSFVLLAIPLFVFAGMLMEPAASRCAWCASRRRWSAGSAAAWRWRW